MPVRLDDPSEMADRRAAFKNNPYAEYEAHRAFTGQGGPSRFGVDQIIDGAPVGLAE